MAAILMGFLLRLGQVALDSALTLVIGAITAGIFRRMVGPAGTRKLFGRGWRGLLRGWTAGMLLPVCALGVIPVARELRRAGVTGGTVLAFVLAAPLLNPISFLYGLSLAEPVVILSFAAASLILSTVAGYAWDHLFAGDSADAETAELARLADLEPTPTEGPRRILAVAITAGRELAGRDLTFYAIGLIGSAILAALIPYGYLQSTMKHADWTSPLLMAGLAVPIYTTPLPGMMKIGLMFDHGNSLAAAFVLFALGIGTSLGTLAWLGTDYGWKRILPWFVGYALLTLVIGYGAEPLLYDTRKAEIDHTHAFDDYSSPFITGTSFISAIEQTRAKLDEKFGPLERPAVYALLGLIGVGWIARRCHGLDRWLTAASTSPSGTADGPWWNRSVPGPVLGLVVLAGLIAFSVIGAYMYYPDRERCLEEMAAVKADAFSASAGRRTEEAIRYLEHWDLLVRKLEVGEYIRTFHVTSEQSKAAEVLREALEDARDKLLAGDKDGARQAILKEVEQAYQAVKAAFPRPIQTSGVTE